MNKFKSRCDQNVSLLLFIEFTLSHVMALHISVGKSSMNVAPHQVNNKKGSKVNLSVMELFLGKVLLKY